MIVEVRAWTEERLGLLALGYSRVLWVHLHCVRHGVFRCGLPEELELYQCPACGAACKANLLAEGFTRRPLPFEPELIVAPLSQHARDWLMAEERISKTRRRSQDWHHQRRTLPVLP